MYVANDEQLVRERRRGKALCRRYTAGEAQVGAGSVVTRDLPANCVAAGNPCRGIPSLE